MKRFVEGADRGQSTLLPECLDGWIDEENPVRVIDAFVDALDVGDLGFGGVEPAATGRPSFHSSVLLKPYIYGYLNRVQSSRRLEREAGRNLELPWLLGPSCPTTTRSPISARTMALDCAKYVHASWNYAASWGCLRRRASPSTAASSKRSTIAIGTSRVARWGGGVHSWKRALRAISANSTRPTGRNRRRRLRPRRSISRRSSRSSTGR